MQQVPHASFPECATTSSSPKPLERGFQRYKRVRVSSTSRIFIRYPYVCIASCMPLAGAVIWFTGNRHRSVPR